MNKFFWKKSERYRGRRTRSSGRKWHAIDGCNTYKTNSTFGPRDPRGLHRSRLPPTVHRFDQTVFLLLLLPLLSPDQPNHPSGTTLFQPRPKRERWGWTQRERETERKSERGVDGGGARGLELALVRRGGEKGTVCFSANPSSPHPSRTGANVKRFRDVKADTRAAHFGPTTSARIVDTCVYVNPFVSSPRWIVQDRWGDPFVPSNASVFKLISKASCNSVRFLRAYNASLSPLNLFSRSRSWQQSRKSEFIVTWIVDFCGDV